MVLFFLSGNTELGRLLEHKTAWSCFFRGRIMSRSRLLKKIHGPVFSKWEHWAGGGYWKKKQHGPGQHFGRKLFLICRFVWLLHCFIFSRSCTTRGGRATARKYSKTKSTFVNPDPLYPYKTPFKSRSRPLDTSRSIEHSKIASWWWYQKLPSAYLMPIYAKTR